MSKKSVPFVMHFLFVSKWPCFQKYKPDIQIRYSIIYVISFEIKVHGFSVENFFKPLPFFTLEAGFSKNEKMEKQQIFC